jgi:hypothetical protein
VKIFEESPSDNSPSHRSPQLSRLFLKPRLACCPQHQMELALSRLKQGHAPFRTLFSSLPALCYAKSDLSIITNFPKTARSVLLPFVPSPSSRCLPPTPPQMPDSRPRDFFFFSKLSFFVRELTPLVLFLAFATLSVLMCPTPGFSSITLMPIRWL